MSQVQSVRVHYAAYRVYTVVVEQSDQHRLADVMPNIGGEIRRRWLLRAIELSYPLLELGRVYLVVLLERRFFFDHLDNIAVQLWEWILDVRIIVGNYYPILNIKTRFQLIDPPTHGVVSLKRIHHWCRSLRFTIDYGATRCHSSFSKHVLNVVYSILKVWGPKVKVNGVKRHQFGEQFRFNLLIMRWHWVPIDKASSLALMRVKIHE